MKYLIANQLEFQERLLKVLGLEGKLVEHVNIVVKPQQFAYVEVTPFADAELTDLLTEEGALVLVSEANEQGG